MLPQWVGNLTYDKFFKYRAGMGDHIILDNGANEGYKISLDRLCTLANRYGVSELVLPDTMGDFEETLGQAKLFLGHYASSCPKWTKFGFVLHGANYEDAARNFAKLRGIKELYDMISVIYIPRMLVTKKEPGARISLAYYIHGHNNRFVSRNQEKQIHLLGASPICMTEVRDARKSVSAIRSMDTSAPYVYALKGKHVDDGVVHREHDTYFYALIDPGTRKLALQSCELMDSWVK